MIIQQIFGSCGSGKSMEMFKDMRDFKSEEDKVLLLISEYNISTAISFMKMNGVDMSNHLVDVYDMDGLDMKRFLINYEAVKKDYTYVYIDIPNKIGRFGDFSDIKPFIHKDLKKICYTTQLTTSMLLGTRHGSII